MTTPELDQLLVLLRARGVIGFEGLGIKVTLGEAPPALGEALDPDRLGGMEEEDPEDVRYLSSGIERRK